jgi:hypothetical protein
LLQAKKHADKETEKLAQERKRAGENIKVLQEKKAKLQTDNAEQLRSIDVEIAELSKFCNTGH